MAERRMFARSIVESDAFLDMPLSARCLYFALGMDADDDGFVGNPKSVMRQSSATQDDLKLLIAKRYILSFDSGVVVIKHWRINNYLRNDRYKPTTYVEELKTLTLDNKGAYTEIKDGIPTVYQMDTQYSIGKDSIGKGSIDSLLMKLKKIETIADVCERARENEKFATACDEVLEALAFAGESGKTWAFGERRITSDDFYRLATKPHGFDGNMLAETVNALIAPREDVIADRRYYILGIIVNRFMR